MKVYEAKVGDVIKWPMDERTYEVTHVIEKNGVTFVDLVSDLGVRYSDYTDFNRYNRIELVRSTAPIDVDDAISKLKQIEEDNGSQTHPFPIRPFWPMVKALQGRWV